MKNENESPFGNPRFLAALAITFFGLWGWQYYMNKKYPPQEAVVTAPESGSEKTDDKKNSLTETTQSIESEKTEKTQSNLNSASEQNFKYEDDYVAFSISSTGMGFSEYIIKTYKDKNGHNVSFKNEAPLFVVSYKDQLIQFNVSARSKNEFYGEALVDGKKVTRLLIYDSEKKFFNSLITVEDGLDSIQIKADQKKITPKGGSFLMPSFELQDFIFVKAGKTDSVSISTLKDGEGVLKTETGVSMSSISSQYFTVTQINKSDFTPQVTKKVEGTTAQMTLLYDLKNISKKEIKEYLYLGPKKTEILNAIDPQAEEVMNYGMFGFISKPLLKLLKFMFDIFGNWGLAIIAMTLIVRAVLLPFNIISFRSAQAMQKIKPKMDEVREKYKSDPVRMNKETMALMKDNNANPVSGCLPMLIQIPIFFALWRAISGSIELYQQPFFGWITDLSQHDAFFVLPILMGITMFLQQKMTPSTMDPTQQKILNFMPIIFTLFMVTLPSGLTLYNFISALFGVIQQYFLLKQKNNNNSAALKQA